MKKILIPIIVLVLFVFMLFLFKNKYTNENIEIKLPNFSIIVNEEEGKLKLINLSSFKSVDSQKNKYIDKLVSCYDEGYFYDTENDITIIKYEVINRNLIRTINIEYEMGNRCEDEFVLESNWYSDLIESDITDMKIEVCDIDCESYTIVSSSYKEVLDYFLTSDKTRIANKERVNRNGEYILLIYHNSDIIQVFKHDNYYVAFNIINQDDSTKNAIYYYEDFRSVQKLFELLDL